MSRKHFFLFCFAFQLKKEKALHTLQVSNVRNLTKIKIYKYTMNCESNKAKLIHSTTELSTSSVNRCINLP